MQLILDFEKKLEDFHLHVHYEGQASRIGILGASGCGKSMTLRSIAGIETPDRGLISLSGRDLFDSEKKINLRPQQRRVGYLFQNYALFPTMTVEQNIMAGVRGSKEERQKRAQEMVHAFQLEGLEKRRPAELSGGQQQRVALARIMAYHPEALLLDEPFSAMDYFLKEKLRLEMKQVLQKYAGLSILVTHDRDEAYQLCDHLLLMHEGSVIADGPTKEIFDHPKTVEAARLTGCKNISRIRPLGQHRICALDWDNLELTTQEEVTEEITHAGIRAHDFFPCADESAENRIHVENPVLTELPFEWYIVLQNKIWWKVPKDIRSHDFSERLPRALCVDPSAIMLLSLL
ncbi:MAG: ATP-binding cassette domain-containing protein [Lachnospiraceae bacterium]|nr:ATP-binding cassette domain-containing protein [Lachnospiraceae bacterium]